MPESPVVSRGSHLKQRLCLFKTALYKSTLMLYHNFLDGFDRASQLTTCAFLIKHCFPDCTTWSGSLFTLLFLQSLKKSLKDFFLRGGRDFHCLMAITTVMAIVWVFIWIQDDPCYLLVGYHISCIVFTWMWSNLCGSQWQVLTR